MNKDRYTRLGAHVGINTLPTLNTNLAVYKGDIAIPKLFPTRKQRGQTRFEHLDKGSKRELALGVKNIPNIGGGANALREDGSLNLKEVETTSYKEINELLINEGIANVDYLIREVWEIPEDDMAIHFENRQSHTNMLQLSNSQNNAVYELVSPHDLAIKIIEKMGIEIDTSTKRQLRSTLATDMICNEKGIIDPQGVEHTKIVDEFRESAVYRESGYRAPVGIDDIYYLEKNRVFGDVLNAKIQLAPKI